MRPKGATRAARREVMNPGFWIAPALAIAVLFGFGPGAHAAASSVEETRQTEIQVLALKKEMSYSHARAIVRDHGWTAPRKPYCSGDLPDRRVEPSPSCGAGFSKAFFRLMPEAYAWPVDAAILVACYDKDGKRLLLTFSYDEDYASFDADALKARNGLRLLNWRIGQGSCKDGRLD